jgi:hypothetical protein
VLYSFEGLKPLSIFVPLSDGSVLEPTVFNWANKTCSKEATSMESEAIQRDDDTVLNLQMITD